jgi:hypothetical protein
MRPEPTLVLFCGGLGGSPVEDTLADALYENALDTLDQALSTGAYGGAILVADAAAAQRLATRLPAKVELDVDPADAPFHFGKRLKDVVLRYGLERPVYIGCGLPLIKGDELAAVASALNAAEAAVVANNYFSADLVGMVPGAVVRDLNLPDNDRMVPRVLVQERGLDNRALPRTIANQFDIDTPGELAILAYAGGAGKRLTAWLEAHPIDTNRIAKAAWCFTDRDAVVLVSGRVSSDALHYLQSETASQTRLYSEERGMQAIGRDLSGEARSLLAFHVQAVGFARFFDELSQMCTAAFIDTRPIFAHMGLQPLRQDRFLSDTLQPEGIANAWIRGFTAAARDARIPVVFGGQCLVTSGVRLLSEAAWREHDKVSKAYKAAGRARERGNRGSIA